MTCKILESGKMIQAVALGNLLKNENTVVVGDYVNVEKINEQEWQIDQVEERKSEIFRIFVRESRKKVTASNCDALCIVVSLSKPAYKRGILDRYLVRAAQWNLEPIVIFNKMDQFSDENIDVVFEAERLSSIGAKVFEVSAIEGEKYKPRFLSRGYQELETELKDKTAVFVGQSGVGKSQTITALSNGAIELKTQEVGKVGKGQHTTTWSELVEGPNFTLIDSPGIRSFSLEDIPESELIHYFPDLEEYSVLCKFTNCAHEANSNGCSFLTISDDATRKIVYSRLESFQRIKSELSEISDWNRKF